MFKNSSFPEGYKFLKKNSASTYDFLTDIYLFYARFLGLVIGFCRVREL
jgi:hypothetical protein